MALGPMLLPSSELFSNKKLKFEISLAQFSYAGELYSGKMTNMDFPSVANSHGIKVLEYVSGFINNKHTDNNYLKELKQRCEDLGMKNNLIMVDGDNLADLDAAKRKKAVESHYPWVDAAKYLGCSMIRVNLGDTMKAISGAPDDDPIEAGKAAAEGYRQLLEYAAQQKMDVIVENHFGNSTNPEWLLEVLKQVNMPNSGLLPDFGNFCIQRSKPTEPGIKGMMATKCLKEYDKYEGVRKMMPYAKGISAKSHRFNEKGEDLDVDFFRMFNIIGEFGVKGYVGIEYEGSFMNLFDPTGGYLSGKEGVDATKKLLEKIKLS